MDDYITRFLKDLNQQIKVNTQHITEAMDEFINSPAMIEAREIANKAKETISGTLLHVADAMNSYHYPFLDNIKNVISALQQFTNVASISSVAHYLGEEQYVWWKIPPTELIKAVTENAQNERARKAILADWIQKNDPTEIILKLKTNKHLSNHPVFVQSLVAYEEENFDVAALGFTACFDKMLSICSGLPTHKITERTEELAERLENTEKDKLNLSEADYNDYYLLVSYQMTIETFNETVPFNDPEPQTLNRNWIMHGRTEKKMKQIDCYKLINILYGTILMAEMAGEKL